MSEINKTTVINYDFFVEGMHCSACEVFVEKTISSHPKLSQVKAELGSTKLSVTLNDEIEKEIILNELNTLLKDSNYKVMIDKPIKQKVSLSELLYGLLIAVFISSAFLFLQKVGIINLVNPTTVTLPFIFFIGVVASLSTCMAVVGGLVLSISSEYSKMGSNKSARLISFHFARLISFFILGGVIGLLGSAFTLSPLMSFVINISLFLVMMVMGINLLDVTTLLNKYQIRMPKIPFVVNAEKSISNNKWAPIILGAITFFLPCGFTQSMQVYALSTGSFISGAMTMFTFALGTLPVIALISFASVKLSEAMKSGLFFKTAGFLVIFFAIINLLGALVAIGIIPPFMSI